MAYDDSIKVSGNCGFMDSLDLSTNINPTINAIRDWMVSHGWTEAGGEKAKSLIKSAGGFPVHSGPSGPPSETPSDPFIMQVDGIEFDWFDPIGGDSDPTGTFHDSIPVIGVPMGANFLSSIANFNGFASVGTPYIWTIDDLVTFAPSYGGTVVAKSEGPDWNIDSTQNSSGWVMGSYLGGILQPRGGGWYVESAAAPNTGDQMRLFLYEEVFEHLVYQVRVNGTQDFPNQGMNRCVYRAFVCPYQFSLRRRADSTVPGTDGIGSSDPNHFFPDVVYGEYLLTGALWVPTDFVAETKEVAHLNDDGTNPLVIQTSLPHGMVAEIPFWITDATPSSLNGRFYVAGTPTSTTLTLSQTRGGTPFVGTGASTAATVRTRGVFEAVVQCRAGSIETLSYVDATSSNLRTDVLVNHEFKSGGMTGRLGVLSLVLPAINVRDRIDGKSLNGKILRQAPYVAVAGKDDEECRIAGIFWDSTIELTLRSFETIGTIEGDRFMVWMDSVKDFTPLVNASLWLRAKVG